MNENDSLKFNSITHGNMNMNDNMATIHATTVAFIIFPILF